MGRKGTVSGHGEVALEGLPGQRVGFLCSFSGRLMKVGWALCKDPGLMCCDA